MKEIEFIGQICLRREEQAGFSRGRQLEENIIALG